MNSQHLRTIFESSGNLRRLHLPQEYIALEKYIAADIVHLESHTLNVAQHGIQGRLNKLFDVQPWDEIEIVCTIPLLGTINNGGGRTHRMMCWCAAAWLLDQGYQVLAEKRFNGCRVDLLSSCKTWVIECGDTSPVPIPKHLLRDVQRIGIVPFQENEHSNLEMFVFSKGKAWNNYPIKNDLVIDFTD